MNEDLLCCQKGKNSTSSWPDTVLPEGQHQDPECVLSFRSLLEPYKARIEAALQTRQTRFGDKTALREAVEYALKSGGKRFRPALVFMMAEAAGKGCDVTDAALAVEFFHTASLIADDLPCMDNDDLRRGLPTVHKVYGEGVALLASFSLIAAGFEHIGHNAAHIKAHGPLAIVAYADEICRLGLMHASTLNGITALIGGQYDDLYPVSTTPKAVHDMIVKKTVSLFELSFLLGWLFGGGDPEKTEVIKKAAYHFGMAFQILDDYEDMEKDKQAGRTNYANLYGKDEAKATIQREIAEFVQTLNVLGLQSRSLCALVELLLESLENASTPS